MKRRILAIALASALSLSLAACGGKSGGGSSSNPGVSGSSSQTDGSASSAPDASRPDGSGAASSGDAAVTLTLNKTEVTLNKAGATFQLRCTVNPSFNALPQYSSSDESVAKVDDQGKITAVAPGTAVITAEHPSATDAATGKTISATCTVTCDWKEESKPETKPETKPEPKPEQKPDASSKPAGGASSSGAGSSAPAPSKVDLQAFYDATVGKYEFGFLDLADKTILDQFYPGMSGVSAEQMLVYVCMMSLNNGEFGLVQVKDSKDVDTVKAIFQARIDYMVGDGNGPGGAQYPMAMDQWDQNSRIVSNGNYVMMVVHENCDDIVSDFNALF